MAYPGPPPGNPPGYPPQPPYASGPGGFGAGKPPKKPNPLLWVGIGCVAVLLIASVAGAAIYFFVVKRTEEALEGLPELPSAGIPVPIPLPPAITAPPAAESPPAAPPPTPGTTPPPGAVGTAIPPKPGASAASGQASQGGASSQGAGGSSDAAASAGASGAAGGSAICRRAASCCRTLLARAPAATAGLSANCDSMAAASDAVCQQQFDAYRQAGSVFGVTCQ